MSIILRFFLFFLRLVLSRFSPSVTHISTQIISNRSAPNILLPFRECTYKCFSLVCISLSLSPMSICRSTFDFLYLYLFLLYIACHNYPLRFFFFFPFNSPSSTYKYKIHFTTANTQNTQTFT